MSDTTKLDIDKALEDIGEAVMVAIAYQKYPLERLNQLVQSIDTIIMNSSYLKMCEEHLRSAGSNYVLFYISNIIYNLKRQGELTLTTEVLKWLGSVWRNFLRRNKEYQEMFPHFDDQRIKYKKYYPGGGSFVNQIENVNLIKEDFLNDTETDNNPLQKLEKFYQKGQEIFSAMKPSYFFLLDYYYERKINTGVDFPEAVALESRGLMNFGQPNYTYGTIALIICQALGILEAAYLILKKKKSSRRIISIDGKQKFLTTPEIYNVYLEKFNALKKEITNLKR